MIETEAEMQTAALAWADDALTRFAPERARNRLVWRIFRPALLEFAAAGYAGGYQAARHDAEGTQA